jgi:hypothetical protein
MLIGSVWENDRRGGGHLHSNHFGLLINVLALNSQLNDSFLKLLRQHFLCPQDITFILGAAKGLSSNGMSLFWSFNDNAFYQKTF